MLNLIGISLVTALIIALLYLRWLLTSDTGVPLFKSAITFIVGILVWSIVDDVPILGAAVLLFVVNTLIVGLMTWIGATAWNLRQSNQAARKDGDA